MSALPAPGQPRVLVVADDLTGANDTGVQFAAAGWPSTLRLVVDPDAGEHAGPLPGVVALSTDSRALPDDEAATTTRDAVEVEALGEHDHLYLKVDSTLRGSVAGQVRGALQARRRVRSDALVVLCPAYPAMGREVRDGVLTVHGAPVTESPAGRDPVTPVRHAHLVDLVPGSVVVPAPAGDDPGATAAGWAATGADVLVVDAGDDDELARVAAVVVALGARAVPAGSAGLAAPLARLWGTGAAGETHAVLARRPLVLVSSHHATAREQVAGLLERRDDVVLVATDADDLLGGNDDPPAPDGDGPVVLVSPDERCDPGRSSALATALGRRAATWLRDTAPGRRFDGVVLVGGDGAEATLRAIDAHGIRIRGRLLEGVPHGHVAGGSLDGLAVVTKAGGFGDGSTLLRMLDTLTTPRTTTPEDSR